MEKKLLFVVTIIIFTIRSLSGQIQSNVYLSGDMNAWGTDAMTYRDLGIDNWVLILHYTGTTGNNNFKFRNSDVNWNQSWGRGATVLLDSKTTWYNNGDNGSLSFTNNKYYTFIFKDVSSGVDSEGTVIETASEPVTISSTYRIPEVVYAWQKPIVYATLSGSLPDGQSVYVRYTTDNFVNSTIIELELSSGNTYKAELSPVGSGSVNYYFFTSGTGLTITPSDADIFTINLLNNNGSNYSYNIHAGTVRFSNTAGTNNWNQTTTWEGGTIPNSTENVVIQHNVVLNQNSTVNSLLVNKDVSFDVNSSSELSISNDLSNNGTLTIKSDATGTGSLIVNGSHSGAINFERYIEGYTTSANGWHFLSIPISGLTISSSSFAPTANEDDLFSFDQSLDENQWLNYNGGTFSDTDFQVGKGYLVAYQNTATKTFSGSTIRTTDYTANLSFTSGKPYAGWNLIGNPFTSAIDWDSLTKSGSVDGAVYVLGYDGTFKSWNGSAGALTDGIIPANQGFFVRSTALSQSILMTAGSNGDQVHSSVSFYKSNLELSENTFRIRLSGANGTDETFVQLRDDASDNFDHAIDAFKLDGFGDITEIYTYDDINKFSINCLPLDLSSRNVKIGVKSLIEGDHQLHFDGLSNISEQYQLKLEDNLTGSIVDVYDNFIYLFNAEIGDNPNRFLLHFGVVGINESPNLTPAYAYVAGQQLHVVQASGHTTVRVLDVQGRLLHSSSFVADGPYSETMQLPAGVYVVNLTDEAGVRNAKIVVRN